VSEYLFQQGNVASVLIRCTHSASSRPCTMHVRPHTNQWAWAAAAGTSTGRPDNPDSNPGGSRKEFLLSTEPQAGEDSTDLFAVFSRRFCVSFSVLVLSFRSDSD